MKHIDSNNIIWDETEDGIFLVYLSIALDKIFPDGD